MQRNNFKLQLPANPQDIYIIGAGGIVNDAHLPAYKIAGFPVKGIYDINIEKATATANKFNIPKVFSTLSQMLEETKGNVVFDVALPGAAIIEVLQQLPHEAAILLLKPMGNNLEEAKNILAITSNKKQIAGVNFQLRYAPYINAARSIIRQGLIGEVCDIEVNVNVYTPWNLWTFLNDLPRVEILYHSIHYIDLVRTFFGNPSGIYAKTVQHPNIKQLASVRTNIIMDYGSMIRANILTNHCHQFGLYNQHSYIKFEGTKGAIKIKLGVLMNYPAGVPDEFEYVTVEEGHEPLWKSLDIEGTWFPHAFVGSMAQVMLAKGGTIAKPDNSVEDCIYTMACVEAAYASNSVGGVNIEALLK
jgi:predicted dehydrogenase